MKILILLESFNCPPRNGGDQAVFNAIRTLQGEVEFHLLTMDGSTGGLQTILNFRKEFPKIPANVFIPESSYKYKKVYKKCLRIANFINGKLGYHSSVRMRELSHYEARLDLYDDFYHYVNDYIKANQIDIVQSEFSFTLGYMKGIIGPVKKVFVQHEIQYVVNLQRLLQSAYSEEDLYLYEQDRNQEINSMNCFDAIITLSKSDRDKLVEAGVHTPIYPSFAQIQMRNQTVAFPIKTGDTVVFIGPESHKPNRHGVKWFLDTVWPSVLAAKPSSVFKIIGNWSEQTIKEWGNKYPNIVFSGFVDDLAAEINGSVMVVPLFQGSGIRMKILEVCNIGIPFVSTCIGAEGLGFKDGEHCFIEDESVHFAAKLIQLLSDEYLANHFVEASMAHVRENFSDECFIQSRMKCYKDLLNKA